MNEILKKLTLGFWGPKEEPLSEGWHEIFLQKNAIYPIHYFNEGERMETLHPQLVFGRNEFSNSLVHFYRNAPYPNRMFLPCILGRTEKTLVFHDFAEQLKHLAISGMTGAGKTSGIYAILFSLMWLNLPNWLKISIFATKSFNFFKPIASVYDTLEGTKEGARQLIKRLRERMELLNKQKAAHTIDLYNELHKNDLMRYEVIIFDEFANILRSLEGEEKNQFIADIAQIASQGRSLGMFLVAMPQRSDVEGLPSSIKPQLGSTLTFRLKTEVDAKTAGCPEAIYLKTTEAILKSDAAHLKVKMLRMQKKWPPFFCKRIQKTLLANGYEHGFK